MEDLEQSLDLEEFIDASMRLYDTIKLPEKTIILQLRDHFDRDKSADNGEYTFQPKLNKNSIRIAAKLRPQGEDIADLLLKKKMETDTRINQMRQQKQIKELDG